jgi:hypothetical protein
MSSSASGTPPTETKGTSSVKWVLGGRYLMEQTRGTIMGQPHEGIGITGYDNYKNMYVATWMDYQLSKLVISSSVPHRASAPALSRR